MFSFFLNTSDNEEVQEFNNTIVQQHLYAEHTPVYPLYNTTQDLMSMFNMILSLLYHEQNIEHQANTGSKSWCYNNTGCPPKLFPFLFFEFLGFLGVQTFHLGQFSNAPYAKVLKISIFSCDSSSRSSPVPSCVRVFQFATLAICSMCICNTCYLQHVEFATRGIYNTCNLQYVQFVICSICNMCSLHHM